MEVREVRREDLYQAIRGFAPYIAVAVVAVSSILPLIVSMLILFVVILGDHGGGIKTVVTDPPLQRGDPSGVCTQQAPPSSASQPRRGLA